VRNQDGEKIQCRIKGKFRLGKMTLTNPVAVGDLIEYVDEGDHDGMIKKIHPRTNYIARQSPRQKHYLHLLAANIDQALLIVTIVEPNLKQGFIDRVLLMTEPQDIPVTILFNKSDVYDEYAMQLYEEMEKIYTSIGYQVMLFSSVDGTGRQTLETLLKDKITLVVGQSGVGKSTAVNHLQPHLDIRTTEISDHSGKGQHTTTFAEMHDLDFGGYIIDTPGIKMLSFNNLETIEVCHNFREFFAITHNCKFGGTCMHRNEPDCAVKKGVEEGTLSELRYINYLQLLEEVEDTNYWERNKEV
jgi:ribosome biogenesis GTPase / thiamine phosphate phosphatase